MLGIRTPRLLKRVTKLGNLKKKVVNAQRANAPLGWQERVRERSGDWRQQHHPDAFKKGRVHPQEPRVGRRKKGSRKMFFGPSGLTAHGIGESCPEKVNRRGNVREASYQIAVAAKKNQEGGKGKARITKLVDKVTQNSPLGKRRNIMT